MSDKNLVTKLVETKDVPLDKLSLSLNLLPPKEESGKVPVAAFNASL